MRYYLELPLTAAQVEQTLVDAPPGWLEAMATAAQERGQGLAARVGFGPAGPRLGRRVALQLGTPVHLPTATWVALRWLPVGLEDLEGLLPRLDATIELGSLGQDRTQLAISARYHPSQTTTDQGIDRALAQRVAETTLKDFLDQLGHAIVLIHLGPTTRIPR